MNATTYRKNREAGKRGQGEKAKPKIIKKGEPIEYTNREGQKAEYPNARGQHMIRIDGKLRIVNRQDARRKQRSNPATKKNYPFQHHAYGFSHPVDERAKNAYPHKLKNAERRQHAKA
jgi:hypothetical protein